VIAESDDTVKPAITLLSTTSIYQHGDGIKKACQMNAAFLVTRSG
jgi:hypothetical protein